MIRVTIDQLVKMVKGQLLRGDSAVEINGVATDSRQEQAGRLFIPLVGERFDAHEFVPQAIQQGAIAVLWQKDRPLPAAIDSQTVYVGVEDTLLALQELAKAYRKTLPLTVIGVTGSNGKTSTKDLITAVLSEKFRVQKTQGNLNNHIGLPLMVLSLRSDTQVAVLEMGMSAIGEIAVLADIAEPQVGIITNIGEAHIEYLGSRARIADAKFELIAALPQDGLAVLFGDEPLLRELKSKIRCPVLWFGFAENNDFQAVNLRNLGLQGTEFELAGGHSNTLFHLPVPGLHQVGNALAAIAIAKKMGMTEGEIAAGLAKAALSAMRLEVKPLTKGGFVVNDAYNASPTSMKAALRMLADTTDSDFKAAVLGDMLELGSSAEQMHFEIGELAGTLGLDLLVIVGEHAEALASGAKASGMANSRIYIAESKAQAVAYINRLASAKQHPVILVKASRGMKLEEVVSGLLA